MHLIKYHLNWSTRRLITVKSKTIWPAVTQQTKWPINKPWPTTQSHYFGYITSSSSHLRALFPPKAHFPFKCSKVLSVSFITVPSAPPSFFHLSTPRERIIVILICFSFDKNSFLLPVLVLLIAFGKLYWDGISMQGELHSSSAVWFHYLSCELLAGPLAEYVWFHGFSHKVPCH